MFPLCFTFDFVTNNAFYVTAYHKITVYNYATAPYASRINRKYCSLNSIEFVCQLVNFPRILPRIYLPVMLTQAFFTWHIACGFLYLVYCIRISIPGILHQDLSPWNIASGYINLECCIRRPGLLHQDLATWHTASGFIHLEYYIRWPGMLHQGLSTWNIHQAFYTWHISSGLSLPVGYPQPIQYGGSDADFRIITLRYFMGHSQAHTNFIYYSGYTNDSVNYCTYMHFLSPIKRVLRIHWWTSTKTAQLISRRGFSFHRIYTV